jgi:acetylornithine deacetylase
MTLSVEKLSSELINIPSQSGEENNICDFVFKQLQTMDFDEVQKIPVDEHGYNIVARKGKPNVALLAHMDVVPPHIPFSEDNDNIYGRGSCDTKGSIASMGVASQRAIANGISDFYLIFTVGEETSMRGAKKLSETMSNLPFAVVGEPTDLEMVNSHFGLLTLTIEAKGKAAHTTNATHGINAIELILQTISQLRSIEAVHGSMMSLVKIQGGEASNIVPSLASVKYSFRLSPDDATDYYRQFQETLSKMPQISMTKGFDVLSVKNMVPKELSFLGKEHTVKYFSELAFVPTGILLGPGSIAYAHSGDEYVPKKQLHEAVDLYYKILEVMTKIPSAKQPQSRSIPTMLEDA